MTCIDDPRVSLGERCLSRSAARDLRTGVAAVADSRDVCRLVSVCDLEKFLPPRALSADELRTLLAALADHGLHLIEPDATDLLVRYPRA